MFKAPVIVLGMAAALLIAAAVAAGLAPAGAHDDDVPPTAPPNVWAADGDTAGVVALAWDGVDAAAFYRIGWVAMDDVPAAQAQGRDWLDAFIFTDVANRGQTAYTIRGLVPGREYAFIVASVSRRFGTAAWSEWAYLTPAGVAVCPEPTPTPPATSGPPSTPYATPPPPTETPPPAATPAPTPTPGPTPTPWPAAGNHNYDTDGDGLIEVSNLEQLAAIRADLNGDGVSHVPAYAAAFPDAMARMGCPSGCTGYELVADLDFDTNGNGEADEGDAYWNDGAGWIPIGDYGHLFEADFEGNNHTIANLYINRIDDGYVGLFGYVAGGNIARVGLVSADVSGHDYVGGLIGYGYGAIAASYVAGSVSGRGDVGGLVGNGDFTISNSYATGSVSGSYTVGGLVGDGHGTISDSYATSNVVVSEGRVGGLVGEGYGMTITASYATGSVSGRYDVGGLVGYISSRGTISGRRGAISGSYAAGSVSGGNNVGGLVGTNHGATISGSYAAGSVAGGNNVGGLVGYNGSGRISGSYATGGVSGQGDHVGGLIGYSRYTAIRASYAAGSVSGGGDDIGGLVGRNESGGITASYSVGRVSTTGGTFYIGGMVGYDVDGEIAASYWDTQSSGHSSSYGGIGKTTAELQSPTGYTGIYDGWNLDLDGAGDIDNPWHFGNASQYPALQYGGLDVAAQRR